MTISSDINRILRMVFGTHKYGPHHLRGVCHKNFSREEAERIRNELERKFDMSDINPSTAAEYRNTKEKYKSQILQLCPS